MIWLKYTPAPRDGVVPVVRSGPGAVPVRGERRINRVLIAVRGLLSHAVSVREAPRSVLGQIYELADSRDLPAEAQGEDGSLFYRLRPVHSLREPETQVDRAEDAELVAMFAACRSARDRLVVLLVGRVDQTRLRLLPRPKTNPEGTKPLVDISTHHRAWVNSLPDLLVPVVVADGNTRIPRLVPFDKTRIFPYAYRHCYAQRHADAGVPVDVLKELMDHRLVHTTMGYYRVGEERRREAVDRAPPCSSTGTATGSGAPRRACSTPNTSAARSARLPSPTAGAVSPPTSRPAATPARSASAAWVASPSPPTSPTSPTSRPTSPICSAAANV
ncbi:hypothetical protein AB0P17_09990 [Streptomyces sp. NPDC088124]|uniref:hypothetical protein n=1 Tax=Streptomyces sp. NPDC088124 TaxID=3154654 RepID=UPI00341B016E